MFNTLLQFLDDGRLTDGQGRTVSFSNKVIIMTSNLGAENFLAALSGDTTMKVAKENVMQEVCPFIFWTLCVSLSGDTTMKAAKENVMQKVCPFIFWTLCASLSGDTTMKAAKENVMQEVCQFIFWTLCASFSYKYHEDDCGVLTRFSLNVVAG